MGMEGYKDLCHSQIVNPKEEKNKTLMTVAIPGYDALSYQEEALVRLQVRNCQGSKAKPNLPGAWSKSTLTLAWGQKYVFPKSEWANKKANEKFAISIQTLDFLQKCFDQKHRRLTSSL